MPGDDSCDARIRIFTPTTELPFAGHPVLGTAFVLAGMRGPRPADTLRLGTKAGIVPVRLTYTGGRPAFGWMQQPLPRHEPFAARAALLAALGLADAGPLPIDQYDNGNRYVYVGLGAPADVAAVRPDFPRLAALGVMASIIFAPGRPALALPGVRAGRRRARGSRHGLGGRTVRVPPGPPRAHRLRRRES